MAKNSHFSQLIRNDISYHGVFAVFRPGDVITDSMEFTKTFKPADEKTKSVKITIFAFQDDQKIPELYDPDTWVDNNGGARCVSNVSYTLEVDTKKPWAQRDIEMKFDIKKNYELVVWYKLKYQKDFQVVHPDICD